MDVFVERAVEEATRSGGSVARGMELIQRARREEIGSEERQRVIAVLSNFTGKFEGVLADSLRLIFSTQAQFKQVRPLFSETRYETRSERTAHVLNMTIGDFLKADGQTGRKVELATLIRETIKGLENCGCQFSDEMSTWTVGRFCEEIITAAGEVSFRDDEFGRDFQKILKTGVIE